MASAVPNDSTVIAKLGGPTALAAALGYSADQVKKWSQRGIPHEYRFDVHQIAASRIEDLPSDFLQKRRPPPKAKRPAPKKRRVAA